MRYSDCTNEELETFVQARRITLADQERTRTSLFRALEHADQHPPSPFRFLDLPAEMRNTVYEMLLDTGNLSAAHPNVVATNKQVRKEAVGLLYDNDTFKIQVHPDGIFAQGRRCGDYGHPRYMYLLSQMITRVRWPIGLKKFKSLRVTLMYHQKFVNHRPVFKDPGRSPPDRLPLLNHALYSLCSFMRDDEDCQLEHLELAFDPQLIEEPSLFKKSEWLLKTKYPLSMLRLKYFTFQGAKIPTNPSDTQLSDNSKRLPSRNVLNSLSSAAEKAEKCRVTWSAIRYMHVEKRSGDIQSTEIVRKSYSYMRGKFCTDSEMFFDQKWEDEVAQMAEDIERTYGRIKFDRALRDARLGGDQIKRMIDELQGLLKDAPGPRRGRNG